MAGTVCHAGAFDNSFGNILTPYLFTYRAMTWQWEHTLALLWLLLKPKAEPGTDTPVTEPEPVAQQLPEVNPADIPAPGVVSASTIARTFIERFGSYSSQSDFANVDDIRVLATASFQAELDQQVAELRSVTDAEGGYTGVSTTVISMKTVSETETETTFLITTQREESVGTPGNTSVRYQDVEVSLVKSGDSWLISDVTWQ